jgi:LysM repeat protein
MWKRFWPLVIGQVMCAGVAISAPAKPGAKGQARVVNYAPEASRFEVEQRLDNHERRIGHLEKVSGTPVVARRPPAEPPTRPAPAPVEPKRQTASTHTVKSGETAFSIARGHGISVSELMKANRLAASATIRPGQKLRIPGASAPPANTRPPGQQRYGHKPENPNPESRYTVREGDTISSLARHHGMTEQELMRRNGLKDPTKLQIGSVLRFPSAAPAPDHAEPDDPEAEVAESPKPLPDGWRWHHVNQGESLSQIAGRYGIDRRTIERVNDLTGGSAALREGVVLKIPPAEVASNERATPVANLQTRRWPAEGDESVLGYTVQKGDSVDSLAEEFKTTASIIRRLNRLGKSETLVAGRRIVVPNTIFE